MLDFFGILLLASHCLVRLLLVELVLPKFGLLPSLCLLTLAGGADVTEEDLEVLPDPYGQGELPWLGASPTRHHKNRGGSAPT